MTVKCTVYFVVFSFYIKRVFNENVINLKQTYTYEVYLQFTNIKIVNINDGP